MEKNNDCLWVDIERFTQMLYLIDPTSHAAAAYVFKHINPYTNIVFGTYEDIAKEMHVSRYVATKNMKALCDKDFIKKIGNGIWFVNPETFYSGDEADYEQILTDYKKEAADQ